MTKRSVYDPLGNLDCVVVNTYTGATRPGVGASLYTDNIRAAVCGPMILELQPAQGLVDKVRSLGKP